MQVEMINKQIKEKIARKCAICGKDITVILYNDKSYRNGHYFFEVEGVEYWECPKCYWGK